MDTNTENQTTQADPNAVPVTGTTTKVDKGTHTTELITFGKGEKEGFQFYLVQYNSLDAVIKKFGGGDSPEAIAKGQDTVLGLVNSAIAFNLRNKAGSKMPDDEKPEARAAARQALLAKGDTVLISEVEAENYIPGTREKTSLASMMKQLKEAKKNGDMELAASLLVSIREKLQEEEDDILKG